MTRSKILIALAAVAAVMAATSAAAGLFTTGGAPFTFTNIHGQEVAIWGQGIYQNESAFKAPIMRGTDAVTLLIVVPLLVFSIFLYRRGTLKGRLLLAAMFGVSGYTGASVAFGTSYNSLLLVYIAWFSSSVFGFLLAITGIDARQLSAQMGERAPRRGLAIFMFLAGTSVLIWLVDIIGALAGGSVPAQLGAYHTEITYVLDLGLIFPAAYLTGVLLLRRNPLGDLLAPVLLVANASVGLAVLMQTIMQLIQGIYLSPGQYIGYVGTFVVMGTAAIFFIARLFGAIQEPGTRLAAPSRAATHSTRKPAKQSTGKR